VRTAIVVVVLLVSGLGARARAQQQSTNDSALVYEREWQAMTNEESTHVALVRFRRTLLSAGDSASLEVLNLRLDAQLKIEDFIIKSREAEYAKYTPLSVVLNPLLALVGALGGSLIGPRMPRKEKRDMSPPGTSARQQ
jgi:hypothetical protein